MKTKKQAIISSTEETSRNKLRGINNNPQGELYLSERSYAAPISAIFIRISAIFFILLCGYDILFMGWNTWGGLLTHYLPGIFLYVFFEISRKAVKKIPEAIFHFIFSLALIYPLLHLTITSPEQYQQIYLFEAVLLTGIYFIVPGKEFSTALVLAVAVSLFMIVLMLTNNVRFDNRWILNLLFYHLLILGGLMVTYLIQGMLNRMVRISGELSSQNIVFQRLKEEFCNTLDGLFLGILLADSKGTILVYNERFQELSGSGNLDKTKNIKELELSIIEPESQYYLDLINDSEEINEELHVNRDNKYYWLNLKGIRIYPNKRAFQYLLLLEDITEQKQNKLARDRLERHLEAVFNPESSIVLYERRDKELYFTDNVKHLTGWSSGELSKGKLLYEELVYQQDKRFIRDKYRKWSKAGKEGNLYLWYRLVRRDGEIIWLEERMSQITTENGGEIITGILIDNTELKTTERELRRSETSLSRAQEIAHLGSWVYSISDGEIRISKEIYKILEIGEDKELNWQAYKQYIHADDQEEYHWKLRDCLEKQKQLLSLEFRIITARNNERVVSIQVKLFWEDSNLKSLEGIAMDITDRKELERQLFQHQKMEAIGTLAGGIAHDFNNILNIIMGYTSVIAEQLPNDSDLWLKFDRISAAAKRAKNLVSHILTISRQHDSHKHSIKMKDLLNEHLELLRAAIPSIIDMKKDLQSDAFIFGDPDQIEQVVMNLCTNACYAMKGGGGVLWIRLKDEGEYVRLEVEDTGGGIPSKVKEKIFDPYYTTKPKGEGTGLGLAIVKGIIDGIEGRIELKSEEGEGTLFSIWLPKYVAGMEKEQVVEEEEIALENKSDEVRVMFIDDEEALVELFKFYLESNELFVSTFVEGKSALAEMEVDPESWDILVSDISLPGMDGLEIVKRARILNPTIPIILYSGFKSPKFEEQGKQLGVNKMLVKPVVPEEMLKEIRRILNKDGEKND